MTVDSAEPVDPDAVDVHMETGPLPSDEQGDLTEIADSGAQPARPRARARTRSGRGPATPDARIGRVLAGRYRVERELAKGGMGRVFLATQLPLERPVAVKVLNPEFQKTDPQFVKRFCLEASISARLSHPNVITIHDYGETESGDLFMAMEFLDGQPLSRLIAREAPLAADRVLHVAIQVCRALREAHSKGVIHRDLKPGNVMVVTSGDDPDFVKVLDFGLVKLFQKDDHVGLGPLEVEGLGEAEDLTRAGTLLGSPRYMSPEQIRGDTLDPRTDIYSLGIILYQMVTGRAPFSGKTSVDVIYKHMNHKVPPLEGSDCPPALEDIVLRCLAKDREDRYASMGDLLLALKDAQRIITGHSSGTDSIPVSQRAVTGWHAVPREPIVAESSDSRSGPRESTEAAFRDPALHEDLTPSGELRRAPRPPPSGRLPLVLASSGFVVAIVALIVVMRSPPPERTTPAASPAAPTAPVAAPSPPPAPVAPREATARFTSTPPGAEVREDGRALGVTPFALRLPVDPAPRRFVFHLDGHLDVAVLARVDSAELSVSAELEVRPVATAEPAEEESKGRRRPRRPTRGGRRVDPDPDPDEDATEDEGGKRRPDYYRDNPY